MVLMNPVYTDTEKTTFKSVPLHSMVNLCLAQIAITLTNKITILVLRSKNKSTCKNFIVRTSELQKEKYGFLPDSFG